VKTLLHTVVALAICVCIAGCASQGAAPATNSGVTPAAIISAEQARDAVAAGKSSKADVVSALGKTTVVRFDSGFEVWVYQIKNVAAVNSGWLERMGLTSAEKNNAGNSEFVVLFAPFGIVAKTRIRPAPAPAENKGR
jgi:hypothetical protein